MKDEQLSLPIVIMKEGEWYVASCPPLDIATQGRTEQEVKANMEDLINEYLNDEDISKPDELELTSVSFMRIPKKEIAHGETRTT